MAEKDQSAKGVELKKDGLHAGDFVIGVTGRRSTDDDLDMPQDRDRARQEQEDERAARHDPTDSGAPPTGAAEKAKADVDASIEDARAAHPPPGETSVPIFLRDPLTGQIIGKVEP